MRRTPPFRFIPYEPRHFYVVEDFVRRNIDRFRVVPTTGSFTSIYDAQMRNETLLATTIDQYGKLIIAGVVWWKLDERYPWAKTCYIITDKPYTKYSRTLFRQWTLYEMKSDPLLKRLVIAGLGENRSYQWLRKQPGTEFYEIPHCSISSDGSGLTSYWEVHIPLRSDDRMKSKVNLRKTEQDGQTAGHVEAVGSSLQLPDKYGRKSAISAITDGFRCRWLRQCYRKIYYVGLACARAAAEFKQCCERLQQSDVEDTKPG